MQGLRTQESSKFEKFFNIVQDAAGKKGCVFFLDAGDGRDFETDTIEGEDLMGWLIPEKRVPDFEKEWRMGDVSDDWSDLFVWAVWNDVDGIMVNFV